MYKLYFSCINCTSVDIFLHELSDSVQNTSGFERLSDEQTLQAITQEALCQDGDQAAGLWVTFHQKKIL